MIAAHWLLTGKRVAEGFGGLGRWARGMRHAPLQLSTGNSGIRRVQNLWREQAMPRLQQTHSGITLSFVLKVCSGKLEPAHCCHVPLNCG